LNEAYGTSGTLNVAPAQIQSEIKVLFAFAVVDLRKEQTKVKLRNNGKRK
jgi:hypothetical protein